MMSEINHAQEAKDLAAGKRVREFLDDSHIADAFAELKAKGFKAFLAATNEAEAVDIWRRAKATEGVLEQLQVTADRAVWVEKTRESRERVALSPRR
jgi:hypothetical protein